MEDAEYGRMREADDTSWWFRGRRRVIARVIAELDLPSAARVADIGCGTGGNLEMLAGVGAVTAVEPAPAAAEMARARGVAEIADGAAEATGLSSGAFDLVTLLDVLEHTDDDVAVLREMRRLLAPGGALVLTVPALSWLYGPHDAALHHRRRYHRRPLGERLRAAGLRATTLTYYNTLLFAPAAAVRLLQRATASARARARTVADTGRAPTLAARVLEATFAAERHLVGRIPMPIGLSLLAVCRAPEPRP